eukprot:10871014-Alexandrium_andersonii.AAC.1
MGTNVLPVVLARARAPIGVPHSAVVDGGLGLRPVLVALDLPRLVVWAGAPALLHALVVEGAYRP